MYRIYKLKNVKFKKLCALSYAHFKSPPKRKMSLDALIIGGNAFHSLLPKKVKDQCTHSKLNGGSSNLGLGWPECRFSSFPHCAHSRLEVSSRTLLLALHTHFIFYTYFTFILFKTESQNFARPQVAKANLGGPCTFTVKANSPGLQIHCQEWNVLERDEEKSEERKQTKKRRKT